MYDDREVAISREYLRKVFELIDEPIALMGGWAVFMKVNENYKAATGREYIGSRDIDLGFHISKDGRNRSLVQVYEKMTKEMGFERLSFRLFKQIDLGSGEELDDEQARKKPSYEIFPMNIDLIVDNVLVDFKERFGFHPVNEELLNIVFKEHIEKDEIEFLGKGLVLPSTNILLAMKIKSYPLREKEHKRIKDLCDIVALLVFRSDWDGRTILRLSSSENIERFKMSIETMDIEAVSVSIGLNKMIVKSALDNLLGSL